MNELKIGLATDLPAPLPAALQQQHVIAIEVCADAAAWRSIAHHEIVQTRVRDEREFV